MSVDLSPVFVGGLEALSGSETVDNAISESKLFKMIADDVFSEIQSESSGTDNKSLLAFFEKNTGQDINRTVKLAHASLTAFVLQSAKMNLGEDLVASTLIDEHTFSTKRAKYVAKKYNEDVQTIRDNLRKGRLQLDQIVNVKWRLDFEIESSFKNSSHFKSNLFCF